MGESIAELRRKQKEFQRSQTAQMYSVIEALRDSKYVFDEVNTLRKDTNCLLEVNCERARGFVQPQYAETKRKAKYNVVRSIIKQEVLSDGDFYEEYQDNACRIDSVITVNR